MHKAIVKTVNGMTSNALNFRLFSSASDDTEADYEQLLRMLRHDS